MTSALGHTVTATVVVLATFVFAILPTCLYRYVEPRGRLQWGTAGDSPRTRRAPALVRVTAWASFAVGQLAVLCLVAVPAACAVLLYLQAKLGIGRFFGVAITAAIAVMALAQSLLAVRLLPLGVRLLARDARLPKRIRALAWGNGVGSAISMGTGVLLGSAMGAAPWLVHPWLRVALVWTAIRPVTVYAAVCLVHALLLGRCVRVLVDGPSS
jgi:hypothetical protein